MYRVPFWISCTQPTVCFTGKFMTNILDTNIKHAVTFILPISNEEQEKEKKRIGKKLQPF